MPYVKTANRENACGFNEKLARYILRYNTHTNLTINTTHFS